jgi:hypothetical protein
VYLGVNDTILKIFLPKKTVENMRFAQNASSFLIKNFITLVLKTNATLVKIEGR